MFLGYSVRYLSNQCDPFESLNCSTLVLLVLQTKLQNALLSLGQFQAAVAELSQWLDRTEKILAEEDQPTVCGDPKIIEIELAKHKVRMLIINTACGDVIIILSSMEIQLGFIGVVISLSALFLKCVRSVWLILSLSYQLNCNDQ